MPSILIPSIILMLSAFGCYIAHDKDDAVNAGFGKPDGLNTRGTAGIDTRVQTEVPVETKEAQPFSIYIMLDQSGSMWVPDFIPILSNTTNGVAPSLKWIAAIDSIIAFINDPDSAGIDVAIQYFPLDTVATSCDGSVYDTPAVPMGRLPDHAREIGDSLTSRIPGNDFTPLEAALRGATRYCKQFKADPVANPQGENCVVILVTDGLPSECSNDADQLARIASDAYADGVITFAVGMAGADFDLLNMIAKAGQGDHDCHPDDPLFYCCNVSTGITLLQALDLIRDIVVKVEES